VTALEQPPEEVFCMTCGPQAVLSRDLVGDTLRCPRCGDVQRVPALPLFLVTGASGTGKTTVTGPLRRLLRDCEVFDTDVLPLQLAALGWATWGNAWLRVVHGIALNGRVTVLCGSMMPSQLEAAPARKLLGPIHACNLDCPDDVLAERLRARPSWRHASVESAITEHQRFAAWLRANIQPSFDTSVLAPGEAAAKIAAWVRRLLADPTGSPALRAP
jgi:predicted kinase